MIAEYNTNTLLIIFFVVTVVDYISLQDINDRRISVYLDTEQPYSCPILIQLYPKIFNICKISITICLRHFHNFLLDSCLDSLEVRLQPLHSHDNS